MCVCVFNPSLYLHILYMYFDPFSQLQTNVYERAQNRKMKYFDGFIRKAEVVVPPHHELRRRTSLRNAEMGTPLPESAINAMKGEHACMCYVNYMMCLYHSEHKLLQCGWSQNTACTCHTCILLKLSLTVCDWVKVQVKYINALAFDNNVLEYTCMQCIYCACVLR